MDELETRRSIIENCLFMNRSGINQGTAGNISVRFGNTMLITPSSTPYETLKPEDIAAMPIEGDYGSWSGPLKPSVEWRFHLDILRARPEIGAVVHTHSTYATALSITRKPIPSCHYMVGLFGGDDIRCGGYARYGTKELSDRAIEALEGRYGCLLANHGMIAIGPNLQRAMWLAVELETVAKQYHLALQFGDPVMLTPEEMAEARKDFPKYGVPQERKGEKAA